MVHVCDFGIPDAVGTELDTPGTFSFTRRWNVLGPTHIGKQVHDPDVRQQMQVYLANELLLFVFSPEDFLTNLNMLRLPNVGILNILSADDLHAEDDMLP